jgi:hypothetical protein
MSSLENNFNENVQLKTINHSNQIVKSWPMIKVRTCICQNISTVSISIHIHIQSIQVMQLTYTQFDSIQTIYNYTSTQVFQCNELVWSFQTKHQTVNEYYYRHTVYIILYKSNIYSNFHLVHNTTHICRNVTINLCIVPISYAINV